MDSSSRLVVVIACLTLLVPGAAFAQEERGTDLLHVSKARVAPMAPLACSAASSGPEQAFPCRSGEVRTGLLPLPDGSLEVVEYELIDGVGVLEGDILLPVDEDGELDVAVPESNRIFDKSTGRSNTAYRWGCNKVPYVNSLTYNPSRVDNAIAHWEANTNLVFVPRTSQSDYVDFVSGSGCGSLVGRQGGRQEITLSDFCSTGSTIHEIGHAVGLWHEHNRSDRDESVVIQWGNIESGKDHNFKTYVQRGEDGFDWGLHDFGSIMHYGSFAFSWNGYPTITKLDGSTFFAQRSGLSSTDLGGVDKMYGLRVQISHWCTDAYRECHFTANVTQGACPIQSYEWFFDDTPETKFGQSVDHTFSSYGWHHVEVLVYDAGGDQAVASADVHLDEGETCIICN